MRSPQPLLLSVLVVATAIGAGLAVPRWTMGVIVLVALVLGLALVGIGGRSAFVMLLVLPLPWLVVLRNLLPDALVTFWAGSAAIGIFVAVAPRIPATRAGFWARVGIVSYVAPHLIALARDPGYAQFIEVSKHLVFPVMVMAVVFGSRPISGALRSALILSGALAAAFQLALGALRLGSPGRYGVGGEVAFGSTHELSLLMSGIAAGALVHRELPTTVRFLTVMLAAVAATVTGVRSSLVALGLVAVLWLGRGRLRPSRLALVGMTVVGIVLSPATNVILTRFHRSEVTGEFSRISTAGSGRGGLWTTLLDHYIHASPPSWLFGAGLGSTLTITQQNLGVAHVAQNDFISVLVELGAIALFGLVVLWIALFRSVGLALPLVVFASFGVTTGCLDYVAPLVVLLVLAMSRQADTRAVHVQPPVKRRLFEPVDIHAPA